MSTAGWGMSESSATTGAAGVSTGSDMCAVSYFQTSGNPLGHEFNTGKQQRSTNNQLQTLDNVDGRDAVQNELCVMCRRVLGRSIPSWCASRGYAKEYRKQSLAGTIVVLEKNKSTRNTSGGKFCTVSKQPTPLHERTTRQTDRQTHGLCNGTLLWGVLCRADYDREVVSEFTACSVVVDRSMR